MSDALEKDLSILEAMASELKSYLLGTDLYGMLSRNLPRRTAGGLLFYLRRLEALKSELTTDQQERLAHAHKEFDEQCSAWRTHYEEKITQELKSRLRNLSAFLDEYVVPPDARHEAFPVEAQQRTILNHLQEEALRLNIW